MEIQGFGLTFVTWYHAYRNIFGTFETKTGTNFILEMVLKYKIVKNTSKNVTKDLQRI